MDKNTGATHVYSVEEVVEEVEDKVTQISKEQAKKIKVIK